MTSKLAAQIVRAVENIVGRSDQRISLDDTCGVCVPTILVLCGQPERRVALGFSNMRSLDGSIPATEEDVHILRNELYRDLDEPVSAGAWPPVTR